MSIIEALKQAYDSLVRTYSPILIGAIIGFLADWLIIPDEVAAFVSIIVSTVAAMIWYGIIRVIEVIQGRASKLLGLELVKAEPLYLDEKSISIQLSPTSRRALREALDAEIRKP